MGLLGKLFGRGASAGRAPGDSEPVLVNAYATVRELPPLGFAHEWHNQRDLSDPELAAHLDGFAGYAVRTGDGQMTMPRYHLWRHIQRVRHQLSFSVPAEDLGNIEDWARQANAILFLPDGSVRAPDMAVLLTGAGETDPGAALPYPPDAVARRERILAQLAHLVPRPPASMPPALGEAEVVLRSAEAVVRRARALACVAVHAEAIDSGEPDIRPRLREVNPQGLAALTPREAAFMVTEKPDEKSLLQMRWRYEALNTLLWALGDAAGTIERSDAIADPAALSRAVLALAREDAPAPSLRPAAEILDALDRIWREHWSVREAHRLETQPEGVNPDIVMERHTALNWLTGFHNDPGTEWDDIDTPS